MELLKIYSLVIIILLSSIKASANGSSFVTISYPNDKLDRTKINVIISDGINNHNVKPNEKNITWNGILYSPFGYISIQYEKSETFYVEKTFFFKSGHTKIFMKEQLSDSIPFFIDEKKSRNIISYSKMGGDSYDAYLKMATDSLSVFLKENKHRLGESQDLIQKMFALDNAINLKVFEYINKYPNSYFSYWLFSKFHKSPVFSPDTLLKIYDKHFAKKYNHTNAGQYIYSVLQNKVNVSSGKAFPQFKMVDIYNDSTTSLKLKGDYVIIQFWASWCKPCIEELPTLNNLYDKYGQSGLKLISISIDTDSAKFRDALTKYEMTWTQVFGNETLYNELGLASIPALYMLNKSGTVIYNRESSKDFSLTLLTKLTEEAFNNR